MKSFHWIALQVHGLLMGECNFPLLKHSDNRRYLLVFASFLLVFGKLSDLYSPKLVFVIGLAWMGILHLGAGFCKNAVALVILKALSGWGMYKLNDPISLLILCRSCCNYTIRDQAYRYGVPR